MLRSLLLFCLIVFPACAGDGAIDATQLNLLWALPFVGVLLSIALFPIFAPQIWHHHDGKVSALWAAAILVPYLIVFGWLPTFQSVAHTYIFEYIPFIILITSLYTITGGIRLDLKFNTSPLINTVFLFLGSLLASVIGTTGAAMLLIRPFLKLNKWRHNKTHLVVFFIFSVCNIGGSLTAVGDPPLLLGFLNGVEFFWTTTHLFLPFLVVTIPLLLLFLVVDTILFKKDKAQNGGLPELSEEKSHVRGVLNFAFLGATIVVILLSGYIETGLHIEFVGLQIPLESIVRDASLILLALGSLKWSCPENRVFNLFTWDPILEVGKLFASIFVTAMPVLAMLGLGTQGPFETLVHWVSQNGEPINDMYFWLTGVLSSFLDNAPTYLVFFHLAGGDAAELMTKYAPTLAAISAGSVFMGAMTYIGNAPNFLVKSIAEINEIRMPTFFGYMGWSIAILLPLFVLVAFFFF